jgi:hypothetical protein
MVKLFSISTDGQKTQFQILSLRYSVLCVNMTDMSVAPLYVATPLNVALTAKYRTIDAKCRNRFNMSQNRLP